MWQLNILHDTEFCVPVTFFPIDTETPLQIELLEENNSYNINIILHKRRQAFAFVHCCQRHTAGNLHFSRKAEQ